MKRLVLVRHGEPACGKGIFYGRKDVELSSRGKEESKKVVEILKNLEITKIFSSPLRRCLYTALELSKVTGIDIEVVEVLQELDFGKWTGKSWEELSKYPEFWRIYEEETFSAPDGESLGDLKQRVRQFLRAFEKEKQGNYVCFTHSGVIRTFFLLLFSLPIKFFFNIEVSYLHFFVFEFFEDGIVLLKHWNTQSLSF